MESDTFYFEGPTAELEATALANRHPFAEVEHIGVVYTVVIPQTPASQDAPIITQAENGWTR